MKIKLLSFNIQHCRNFITREIDVDGVVNLIKNSGADIIGLNEIYGEHKGNLPQYQEIAEKLGFDYYFGKTFTFNGTPFGNAIVSRYKLKNPETIMIPDPPLRDSHWYETRCIIKTGFENFDLNVLVTHFGLFETEQENALKTTIDILNNLESKVVFMGDLNMEIDNPKVQRISSIITNTLTDDSLTYPSINPEKKIDYIFISKDIKLLNSKIITEVVSDHFPHYAEIEI